VYVPIFSEKNYIASIATHGTRVNQDGRQIGWAGRAYTDRFKTKRTTRIATDNDVVANAHLIAAAPDMYEALKAYQNWLNKKDNLSLIEIDGLINRALAKADGK